jgi:cell division protein FtsQ
LSRFARFRLTGVGAVISACTVIAIAFAAGTTWYVASGKWTENVHQVRRALVQFSADAGLRLREVYVTGRVNADQDDLRTALGATVGMPMVEIDPLSARSRIEALGWVRRAVVERRLPDKLYIHLTEKVPLALWQRTGKFVVVDRLGEVVPDALPEDFASLLLIVGDDAPLHAAKLMAVFRQDPALARRIAAAVRIGGRRWNLRFDNGIDVRMPEEGLMEAWRRLAAFERSKGLLAREISALDLRIPDRLVVRPAKGAPTLVADDEKST